MITYEKTPKVEVQWNHIDGPLLHLSTGEMHWLTWLERFQLHFNLVTIDQLNLKHAKGKKSC